MEQQLNRVPQIELQYNSKVNTAQRPVIKGASEAYQLFIQDWNKHQIELIEEFKVMLLNRRNAVLGIVNIAKGGITRLVADPKLIFVSALKSGATRVILAHNHPGGTLSASAQDIAFTRKIQQGANLLGIDILDHLILNKETFYSLTDQEQM